MPKELCCNVIVTSPSGNGVIIVGGSTTNLEMQSSLYEMRCGPYLVCEWYEMTQKLQVARFRFVAMLIPDEITNCNNRHAAVNSTEIN